MSLQPYQFVAGSAQIHTQPDGQSYVTYTLSKHQEESFGCEIVGLNAANEFIIKIPVIGDASGTISNENGQTSLFQLPANAVATVLESEKDGKKKSLIYVSG